MTKDDWAMLAEGERAVIAAMDKLFEQNKMRSPQGDKHPVVVAHEVAGLRLSTFARLADPD